MAIKIANTFDYRLNPIAAPTQPATIAPIRVAWLIGGEESFGAKRAISGLAGAVRPLGVEPIFLSLAAGPFAQECSAAGFAVQLLGLTQPPRLRPSALLRPFDYLRLQRYQHQASKVILEAARQAEARAMHVLWPDQMPLAAAAARCLAIPCFWEMPNAISNHWLWDFNRWFYQRQTAHYGVIVLANSRYTATTFGDRPIKPHVLYLGTDAARFDPARVRTVARAELGIPENAAVMGIFARIEPGKGQDRALAAALPLAREHNLHLLLVGAIHEDQPFIRTLQDEAAAAGLAGSLHVVDATPEPERYYGVVDIAVNATVAAESFGFSVVEAMMMEKPVLAHALGGPTETVLDGITGWHVREPTAAALQAGLIRAMGDQSRWGQMGTAGRTRALEHFSLGRQAQQYIQLLSQALAPAWPAGPARSGHE